MRITGPERRRFKGVSKAFMSAFGDINENLNLEKIH